MKTDSEIKQDILDELAWQPNIDETQIGVIVEDGVVTLTGIVNEFSKKVAAKKAVKSVVGVKAIAEDIEVKYGDDYKKSDQEIAKAAVNTLEWNASVPKEKVMIAVENGYIYLSGKVDWEYQKNSAKRAVAYLMGVKGVVNNIEIQPKVKPSDVKDKIARAFKRSADVDASEILIDVEGSTVRLRGTVNSIKEKEDAQSAAFRAPGIIKVKNELKVQFYPQHA